jgi:hypothetical protein
MKTKNDLLFSVILASASAIGLAAPARAQSDAGTTPAKQRKATAKTHKVWTEDDLATVRKPADAYADKEAAQTQAAAQPQGADATKQASDSKPDKPPKVAPLAHANSVDDADKKIAWEERDIQGQEETIARLQEEFGQASPDRKERLQQLIEQHKQILEDVRKELAGLQAQRKQLEKHGAPNATASAQPPQ